MSVLSYNDQFKERFLTVIQILGGLKKCSEVAGVTDEQVAKWRDGKSKPQFFAMCSLAESAGIKIEWLLSGKLPMRPDQKPVSESLPTGDARKVQLIGMASCGEDGWARLETTLFEAETPKTISNDPDAFAIIARGESMQPFGIYEGFLCFCSPATELKIGDIVCVERKLEDGTISLTIKKLGMIGHGAFEIIGYSPLEEVPGYGSKGYQFQKLFWETVHEKEIDRISVVTHIHTRPSAM